MHVLSSADKCGALRLVNSSHSQGILFMLGICILCEVSVRLTAQHAEGARVYHHSGAVMYFLHPVFCFSEINIHLRPSGGSSPHDKKTKAYFPGLEFQSEVVHFSFNVQVEKV